MFLELKLITIAILLTVFPLNAFSIQSITSDAFDYRLNNWSMSAALGYLSGESNEYVYDDDTKISQLNWKINRAAILKGEANYEFRHWLTVNLNGWMTLGQGQSVMDDYDWLNPNQTNWTDWSHSPNTFLTNANELDLNLRGWLFTSSHAMLGFTVGYEYNAFAFLSRGGCYRYDNDSNLGCSPDNEKGIGYRQEFNIAYLGLAGNLFIQNIELNGLLKFGPWVDANDEDEHYLRALTFKEHGTQSRFYSAALTAGYFITPHLKLLAEGSYSQFTNGKADTIILDNESGALWYEENAAGLSNHNYTFLIGLALRY